MNSSPSRDFALRITGGSQLAGDLCVSGSKNAALPEMAAALLTSEPLRLTNVPKVSDTELMAQILTELGGRSEGEGSVVLRMGNARGTHVPDALGRRMRATIVLLGALLGRFGQARLPRPGGDDIGARRVEQHMRGLRQMGARIEETATEIVAEVDRLHRARIVFDLPTVTGTENILLAAVLAAGRTEIFNAAREPHVQDLCMLLGKMGAHIEGIGTERLVVDGVRELGGAEHTVIAVDPDPPTSLEIVKALPKGGSDIIEIGMPFTDPMADGPAIQASGLRALKAGMTLPKTLDMVR